MIHVFHRIFIENRLSCGVLFLNVFLSKWKLLFYTFLIIMKIIANHHYNTWLDWKKQWHEYLTTLLTKLTLTYSHTYIYIYTHGITPSYGSSDRSCLKTNNQETSLSIFYNVVPFDRLIISLRFRFMRN